MTPQFSTEQITASRDNLLGEGLHARSTAILVHEQLICVTSELQKLEQEKARHDDAAAESIRSLQAECERLREAAVLAAAPLEAINMSGSIRLLGPDTQAAILEGIDAVRSAISGGVA
jgi:hypothetical protein